MLGRTSIPFEEMVKLDYLYVTNWSLWTDVRLLLRTLPAVTAAAGPTGEMDLGSKRSSSPAAPASSAATWSTSCSSPTPTCSRSTTSASEAEGTSQAAEAGAELVVGDVRDSGLMDRAQAGADVVIHMACDNLRASLGDPMRTHEVNGAGALVTALAAVRARVERFVYVSSSEAYGSAVTVPMSEAHPLRPTTVYGASKAAGELYAQACMRT